MSHMVIFRTPEGKPGYQPAETVEDAVEIVERLRNDDGVENVRIFRLEELSFEYRPYYKVELAGAGQQGDDAAPTDGFAPALGEESHGGESLGGENIFDDPEASAEAEGDTEYSSDAEASDERPQEPVAAHPPWAAPPPPPPPPGAESPFGAQPSEGDADDDDEFSGAGQRRGLFGR